MRPPSKMATLPGHDLRLSAGGMGTRPSGRKVDFKPASREVHRLNHDDRICGVAHRDISCLRTNLSPETGPISMGRRQLIGERANLRMGDVAKCERRLRTQTAHVRTLAPSGSVEPKHWHLVCTRIATLQEAGPKFGASFRFGRPRLAARKVPQSTPNSSNDSDYRNNHRHQGAEPVRFSNGQQQT